jgi:DNA repair exonuclease SbcCD ATPase subunit
MRNLLLLSILLAGGMAGYLIGDYRGKSAREALAQTIETGKKLDQERQTAIAKLETDLNSINEKHQQEIEESRKEYDTKSAEWQREKAGLTRKIGRLKTEYAEKAAELKKLIGQLDGTTGTAREELERKIERLQTELGLISSQIEGNACLSVQVPQSVHDALALKMSNRLGEK